MAVAAALVAGLALWPATRAQKARSSDLTIEVEDRLDLTVGHKKELSVTLRARGRQTVSSDGELSLRVEVDPADVLELPRRQFSRRHAADPRAEAPRFDLQLSASRAGVATLALEAEAWVCGRHTCVPAVATARVRVEVAAPPADAGPPDAVPAP